RVVAVRDVVVQRLKQEVPGQLGALTRRVADAGVNIEVLYSDHANRLILVVDDVSAARAVAEAWSRAIVWLRRAARWRAAGGTAYIPGNLARTGARNRPCTCVTCRSSPRSSCACPPQRRRRNRRRRRPPTRRTSPPPCGPGLTISGTG